MDDYIFSGSREFNKGFERNLSDKKDKAAKKKEFLSNKNDILSQIENIASEGNLFRQAKENIEKSELNKSNKVNLSSFLNIENLIDKNITKSSDTKGTKNNNEDIEAFSDNDSFFIFSDDEFQNAKKIALDHLNRTVKTKKELYEHLISKDIKDSIAQKVVDYIDDLNLINDDYICKTLISNYLNNKHYSRFVIKTKLLKRKLDISLIEKYMQGITEEKDFESLSVILKKKDATLSILDENKKRQRLINFAIQKGFRYDTIKSVINNM